MPVLDTIQDLGNGTKKVTVTRTNVSENSSSVVNPIMSVKEIFNSGTQILTPEEVIEQIRTYTVSLLRQLEDLTRGSKGCRLLINQTFLQGQVLIVAREFRHWTQPK